MFDNLIYTFLAKVHSFCECAMKYIKEKKLPKEAREDWLKGYKRWRGESKK